MFPTVALLLTLAFPGPPAVESICLQIAPANAVWTRSANRTQAILLIHGYHYHFSSKNVPKAELRPWQKAESPFVKELGKTADVFSFGYGQNVELETIVKESKLASTIASLRKLGYTDIILIGHSAGGLIARQFVEDNPDAGVTRVVQVCAPNGGSPLAGGIGTKSQAAFLDCLSVDGRKKCLEMRAEKRIPEKVQFVCVIARTEKTTDSDGVVPCKSQWTPDLQKQGIPAVGVIGSHREVVHEARVAETLVGLLREKQTRWSPERIDQAKKEFLTK